MKKAFKSFNFFASNSIKHLHHVSRLTEILLRILFQEMAVKIPSYKSYFRGICYLLAIFYHVEIFFFLNLIFNVVVTAYELIITLKHGINACSGFVSNGKKTNSISSYFSKILAN